MICTCQNQSLIVIHSRSGCAGFCCNHSSNGQSDVSILTRGNRICSSSCFYTIPTSCAGHDLVGYLSRRATRTLAGAHTAGGGQSGRRRHANWCSTSLLQCLSDICISHGKACTRKACQAPPQDHPRLPPPERDLPSWSAVTSPPSPSCIPPPPPPSSLPPIPRPASSQPTHTHTICVVH